MLSTLTHYVLISRLASTNKKTEGIHCSSRNPEFSGRTHVPVKRILETTYVSGFNPDGMDSTKYLLNEMVHRYQSSYADCCFCCKKERGAHCPPPHSRRKVLSVLLEFFDGLGAGN